MIIIVKDIVRDTEEAFSGSEEQVEDKLRHAFPGLALTVEIGDLDSLVYRIGMCYGKLVEVPEGHTAKPELHLPMRYDQEPHICEASCRGLYKTEADLSVGDSITSWVLEKAIKDIKPGKENGQVKFGRDEVPSQVYDYSHVVPHQRQHQYKIEVHERQDDQSSGTKGGIHLSAFLIKHPFDFVNDDCGKVMGTVFPKYPNGDRDLRVALADIYPGHRGKKLGLALYEALYAHAKYYHNVTHAGGGIHSSMAHNAHMALSQRHGMEYASHHEGLSSDNTEEREHDYEPKPGGFHQFPEEYDDAYGPYLYAVKHEDGLVELLTKADRGHFKEAGFRLKSDGSVWGTGPFHNFYELPDSWKVDEDHLDHIEAGFIGHDGKFFTRAEAAAHIGKPKTDAPLQSEDMEGMGRKAGQENEGGGAGLVKMEGQTYGDGTSEYHVPVLADHASQHFQIQQVPIGKLKHNLQTANTDEPVGSPAFIARAQSANLEHPLIVVQHPNEYHVADGMHRLFRHIQNGATHVPAYVIPHDQMPEHALVKSELYKMAIEDIPPGMERQGQKKYGLTRYGKFFDYSHVLSPVQKRHYYLTVVPMHGGDGGKWEHAAHERAKYYVRAYSRRLKDYRGWPTQVGEAMMRVKDFTGGGAGTPGNKALTVDDVRIHPRFRGRGLGLAIYEAGFAHAKHKHDVSHVVGDIHSSSASGVHRKLSAKHGLEYHPVEEADEYRGMKTNTKGKDYDGAYGPYQYALKGEMPMGKMALADIKPGKAMGVSHFYGDHDSKIHDYTHVLPMKHQTEYEVEVHHSKHGGIRAHLIHTYGPMRRLAGFIEGHISPRSKQLEIDESLVDTHHRNKGLGTHLYEALMAHAYHQGVREVTGDVHSSMASRSHQKLSDKHGFQGYNPETAGQEGRITPLASGPYDGKLGSYQYTIKSDDSWLSLADNLSTTISDDNAEVVEDMVGFAPTVHSAFDAARFLVNGKERLSLDQIRRALWLEDGDFERAALRAYQIPVDEKGLKTLRAVMKMGFLKKAATNDTDPTRVECPIGLSAKACTEVQAGIARGMVQHVNLNGKYSRGSMVVRDPKTEHTYLLKPDSEGISPAAGVAEQKEISQPRREACFWQIANMLGMGDSIPRADLIMLDGQEWAAIRLLPFNFKNLEKHWKTNRAEVMNVLERFRSIGTLHKWAVLDYILGNPDRHGQNLMIGHAEKMAPIEHNLMLIDHGSAFAGYGFAPSNDKNSFIPFYLRAWANPNGFNKLSADEKMRQMPTVSHEVNETLKRWLRDINPTRIAHMAKEYGIDPAPIEARIAKIMMLPDSPDIMICKLWSGAA